MWRKSKQSPYICHKSHILIWWLHAANVIIYINYWNKYFIMLSYSQIPILLLQHIILHIMCPFHNHPPHLESLLSRRSSSIGVCSCGNRTYKSLGRHKPIFLAGPGNKKQLFFTILIIEANHPISFLKNHRGSKLYWLLTKTKKTQEKLSWSISEN
jgi:hypothetical protein